MYADCAHRVFSEHLKEELERQGCSAFDIDSFELVKVSWPRQPDGVSCGVCSLMAMEILISQGADAFDAFVEAHRGGGFWTAIEIRRARARWACELLVPPGGEVQALLQEAEEAELDNFVDLSDD
jgi:hypothetical protein